MAAHVLWIGLSVWDRIGKVLGDASLNVIAARTALEVAAKRTDAYLAIQLEPEIRTPLRDFGDALREEPDATCSEFPRDLRASATRIACQIRQYLDSLPPETAKLCALCRAPIPDGTVTFDPKGEKCQQCFPSRRPAAIPVRPKSCKEAVLVRYPGARCQLEGDDVERVFVVRDGYTGTSLGSSDTSTGAWQNAWAKSHGGNSHKATGRAEDSKKILLFPLQNYCIR